MHDCTDQSTCASRADEKGGNGPHADGMWCAGPCPTCDAYAKTVNALVALRSENDRLRAERDNWRRWYYDARRQHELDDARDVEARANLLERLLERTRFFLTPEITRGPAIPGWLSLVNDIEAAIGPEDDDG